MKRTRAVVAAVAAAAGAALAGCTGILGLDATTLAGGDASTSDATAADAHVGGDAGSDGTTGATDTGTDASPADVVTADTSADGPAPGDGGPPDGPVFTTSPSVIGLHPDASLDVTVSVVRNGLAGALAVTFTQLPTGVTSGTGTIAADAGSAQVTVQAAGNAPAGSAESTIQANGVAVGTVPVDVFGASGASDTSFGGGIVIDKTDASGSLFYGVAVDPTSRVVAGGMKQAGGWMLRRYANDGTSDTAFATATAAWLPTTGSLNALALDPTTGVIVCAGTAGSQLAIAVVDSSGNLSGAFNSGSLLALTVVQAQSSSGTGVAIEPGARFSVVGGITPANTPYLVAHVPEVGAPTFAGLPTYDGPAKQSFTAVAVGPDGGIVAAGSDTSAQPIILVERFQGASLDPTFGDGGVGAGSTAFCQGTSVAVRPGSGAVLVGGYDISTDDGCFSGWNAMGQRTFQNPGTGGGGGAFTYWGAVATGDPQDHVYIAGSGGDQFGWGAELDRVNVGGAFDTNFGTAGQVILRDTNSPPAFEYDFRAVAVGADGRIIVAGSKKDSTGSFPMLARYWP
ncbi:MAG TPA: hypothetical protein VGG39_29650 [Polyangiaceae bacterium]|jgi:hypothetical protein